MKVFYYIASYLLLGVLLLFFLLSIFPTTEQITSKDPIYLIDAHQEFVPKEESLLHRELFYTAKIYGLIAYKTTFYKRGVAKEFLENLLSELLSQEEVSLRQYNKLIKQSIVKEINRVERYGTAELSSLNKDSLCRSEEAQERWISLAKDLSKENKALLLELLSLYRANTAKLYSVSNSNIGTLRRKEKLKDLSWEKPINRLYGLFDFCAVIHYFYPNRHLLTQAWDLSLQQSIPFFLNAHSPLAYHKAIRRLTAKLNDSHTAHVTAMDTLLWGSYRPYFRLIKEGKSFFISSFIEENRAVIDKVNLGDEILSVNGTPINLLYDSLQHYISASSEAAKDSFITNAVLSSHSDTINLKLKQGNKVYRRTLSLDKMQNFTQRRRKKEKRDEAKIQACFLTDSIAYWNLVTANKKNIEANYKKIQSAKYIILDLRCYPYPSIMEQLANLFVPPTDCFAYVIYPSARNIGAFYYKKSAPKMGANSSYKGRIIILVDLFTESYSEYLAMLLQSNPNTITVGSPTSGADGDIHIYYFPGNVPTIFTGLGLLYPNMCNVNGAGVKIDYPINPKDFLVSSSKEDFYVQKALQIINEKGLCK